MTPALLNAEEVAGPKIKAETVAALLGVSKRTVYRYADEQRIPAYRIGGVVRFDMADIKKFLEEAKSGSKA